MNNEIKTEMNFLEEPLVSIYLPTRSRLKSLIAAIDSVLSQDYKNIELIVVDDGSSDGTIDYLSKLKIEEERLVVINNKISKGAPAARNQALIKSKGYFVTGIDDDDLFESNRIGLFVVRWKAFAQEGINPSCLYTNSKIMCNEKIVGETNRDSCLCHFELFSKNKIGNQIFTTRKIYFDAGLFDNLMPAWQDLEFFMRVLKINGPAQLVDESNYIVDLTPRKDRITKSSKDKLIYAWKRMEQLHAKTNIEKKKLMIQLFWNYSITPSLMDIINYNKLGIWGVGKIEAAALKGIVKKWLP